VSRDGADLPNGSARAGMAGLAALIAWVVLDRVPGIAAYVDSRKVTDTLPR
jgi:hypothetical protein